MAFKLDDYKCNDCELVAEYLIDTKEEVQEELKCQECGSVNLTKVLGVGTGNKQHFSWAKWRV